MRILVDIRLLGGGGQSGVEEYTRQMISHLNQLDQKNEYLFFYNGLRKKAPLEIAGQHKIIDWHLPNNLLSLTSKILGQPQIDLATGVDLIYSPHLNIIKSAKAPRIMTIHDLSFIHHPYFFNKKSRLWHWLQDITQQAQQAAAIVTVSQFTKKDISETLKIPPEKIAVIYPGVNPIFTSCQDVKNGSYPYILYLGTVEPRKNIEAIIEAFNLLKLNFNNFRDLKLVIAGKLGWLYQNVVKTYERSPYKKHILFLGQVNNEQRISLYQGAEVFVYPSFFEGFGLPPLEAQACGCPVVSSNRTSLPEALGTSALLVDPWQVGDLANSIKSILINNNLKRRLVAAGRQNVQRFKWEQAAENLCDLFSQLF